MTRSIAPISVARDHRAVIYWDIVAALLVLGVLVFLAEASRGLLQPLPTPSVSPISLDPSALPEYAARTSLRMLTAMALSLAFTFTYATWAAKSRRAELILLPLLDILQSVPILGFISVTAVFFMSLAPGRVRPGMARMAQPVAQFMAAFPANLLFPIAVSGIVAFRLDPDIWLSPLMILGTQWYILFNIVAGASAIPSELRDVGTNLRIHGWLWWRRIALPAIFPFYVTGAITASGGSWNASIVAEVVSWGQNKLHAHGLGAYIANATETGDFHRVVLGIAVMSAFVILINRAFWRLLYRYAERKFRLG